MLWDVEDDCIALWSMALERWPARGRHTGIAFAVAQECSLAERPLRTRERSLEECLSVWKSHTFKYVY